jgi:MIP family channel proteins
VLQRRWASISDRRRSRRSRGARFVCRRRSSAPSVIPKINASFPCANLSVERSMSPLESMMSNRIAPKLLAEFIGTFSFVFIGAGAAAVIGDGVGLPGMAAIALAHGLTIMAFAFAYGSVSGGHFNPSVTVGVLVAGAMGFGEAIGYIVSQLIGGVAGALLLRIVLDGAATGLGVPALAHNLALGATSLTITPEAGFVIEAALAFFLVTVVLSTAVAGRAGSLAPLAIGMTVTLNILMGGALTGAPFNPARALGPMVATGNFSDAWLYLTAPIVGAIFAAIVHTGLVRLAQERKASAGPGSAARTPAE